MSPRKLRNLPRMKLWEQGKPGSSNLLSLADNKASVSKQQDQGQREREEKKAALRTCRKLVTNRWLKAKERDTERTSSKTQP